jgi:hypothetical protein
MENKKYVVRTEGHFNSYGIGEVVSAGVAFFKEGFYNLTKDELNTKLKQLGKVTLR